MQELNYIGNELELFQHAQNWKRYFGGVIGPYIKGSVLEVGAGIGATTQQLCNDTHTKWVCLEPDPRLFGELKSKVDSGQLPPVCEAVKGTTRDLSANHNFDTILYIDVIEHIENDGEELRYATNLLANGGHLVVLVPAHQYLFSPFDKAIGHYRRYNKKMLRSITPPGLRFQRLKYLDSMGLLASMVNKLFLKQKYPTLKQVMFWDKTLVKTSRVIDPLINFQIGKTVIAVWKK
jgi:hypothetical protein